ncbi:hypothetical protein ACE10Z_42775 [Bradyrhizobium sp. Pha-3]|uniref:hypothetical protein n=1 Tax=Bradyrhizobium sp. Pha-3 TaxID=208375 RepID=UPI0035D46E3F
MITSTKFIFLVSVALTIPVIPTARADDQNKADLPSDVMRLISRRSSCVDWSQKAFESKRRAQLDEIMGILESLKCGDIADDEKELREKYASSPDILRALDSTWTKFVKRLPVRIAIPPDQKD